MFRFIACGLIILASSTLFASTAQAAFIAVTRTGIVGQVTNFDIVYDPEGAPEIVTMDFGITTDVVVASITGTWTGGITFGTGNIAQTRTGGDCGGGGTCVIYGGLSIPGVATPGPVVIATVSIDPGPAPLVRVITTGFAGGAPTLFNSEAGQLPNNTVNPLATVPEPRVSVLLSLALLYLALRLLRGTGSRGPRPAPIGSIS